MPSFIAVFCVLLPILTGLSLFIIRFKTRTLRNIYTIIMMSISSAFTLIFLFNNTGETYYLWYITEDLFLSLKVDGLGTIFAALISILWPPATLYAFDYMKHEKRQISFFAFFTMTYGITLGISLAADMLTMYVFYEFLTLITIPLVFHFQTDEARRAMRKYMYYSIGGASLGFIAIAFVIIYGNTLSFDYGGVLNVRYATFDFDVMRTVYVIAFMGFGVKAAVFPLHGWLPTASVAPTPVTALLHAVAVVKSGAFVIMRVTYYIFGSNFLEGSFAQIIVIMVSITTILFGSIMAVKERHIKRRLAYSTISNLSYILLGIAMMSPLGFAAALLHMIFHAVMKICLFFCAGGIMHYGHKTQVEDLEGLGKKMPLIFTCFTVAAVSLMGVPPLIGFYSKSYLAMAAIDLNTWYGFWGAATLFVSAALMAIYLLFVSVRAFFPREDFKVQGEVKKAGILMKIPIAFFALSTVFLGFFSAPILSYIMNVSHGFI